jgi:hypothetical protein
MRSRHIMFMMALLIFGGASKLDRLTPVERDHFDALRVWFTSDKDEKLFLKLKTEEERNQWLKDRGYWERFYKYDEAMRDAIVGGEVMAGWPYDAILMAWGPPHQKMRLPGRMASRSEMYVYQFEILVGGAVMVWEPKSKESYQAVAKYRMELYIDDAVLTSIVKKDGWDD